jgi:four helix bundle protein
MQIYNISKSFPDEEKYSLTNQMRRSSRSVCANLAEAWRKRKYIAAFKNKLTDSMMEAAETQTWLEFCLACNFIEQSTFESMDKEYEDILKMLNSMEKNAEKFCY